LDKEEEMANVVNYNVTGVGGDYYGTPVTLSIAASSSSVIPKGYYYILPDANGTIQFNKGGTWVNVASAGIGGFHFSDGATIRVAAGASASTTVIIPILITT
jgi:hypothetical protein